MYQFADLLDDGEYKEAIGIMSLYIRGFESGSSTYTGGPFALLESGENMRDESVLMETWKNLYMDDEMDRRRVIAIGHVNRAAMNMFVYRCRWLHRYQIYLLRDLRQLSVTQLQAIRQDFERTRGELEWAQRDCETALRLNPFSILAHSHMLTIQWELYRSDVLMFILELMPTIDEFFRTDLSPPSRDDDNVPVRSRLRAEFGDMAQRLHELCKLTTRSFKRMRTECDQISSLAFHLGIGDGSPSMAHDSAWRRLRYVNRRFYGMSSATALAVQQDAADLESRLDCTSWMLDEFTIDDVDKADGLAVLTHAAEYWVALNAGSIDDDSSLSINPGTVADMFWCNAQDNINFHPFDSGLYYLDKFVEGNFDFQTLPAIGPKKLDDNLRYSGSFSDDGEEVNYVYSSSGLLVKDLPMPPIHFALKASLPPPFFIRMRMEDVLGRDDTSSSSGNVIFRGAPTGISSVSESSSSSSEMVTSSIDSSEDDDSSDIDYSDQSHCNFQTIKDVNFVFDRYIASGSDDGRLFIWDRQSMEIVQILRGDNEVVNIIESHPTLPLIAVSGIDCEVHIFSINQGGPSHTHRRNFPLVRQHPPHGIAVLDETKSREDIYAPDPYIHDLLYSGHSIWPSDEDYEDAVQHIPRSFPAVSESELANKAQIVSANQELRLNGITNASLTHRLMSNIFFGAMLGSRRIINDTFDQSDDDMDGDYNSDMDGFSDGFIREARNSAFLDDSM
ncbi:hypothetical protein FBU59_002866 [Linderina macrospora]|uniref:Uncharacterized protein n=1 Tax=Linderina macrospora TaxID=4868 RepID=A0ACC1J9X9_9FUNG|nr:hypothetical protein FBU59_002866 [Linderina macrospora]